MRFRITMVPAVVDLPDKDWAIYLEDNFNDDLAALDAMAHDAIEGSALGAAGVEVVVEKGDV